MVKIPQTRCTNDYSIFKFTNLNRQVNQAHVRKIKKELERDNYFHLKPVICNGDMEIISGQHRFHAAKEMGLDIYYVVDPNVSYEFILNDNSVQRTNSLTDVINFWSRKDKKESYVQLEKYIAQTGMSAKAIMALLFGSHGATITNLLRSGDFIMPSDKTLMDKIVESYLRFIDSCHQKHIKPLSMFEGAQFAHGFRALVIHEEFDVEKFFKKVEEKWYEIKPQINHTAWSKLLLNIYNYRNHQPISEDTIL